MITSRYCTRANFSMRALVRRRMYPEGAIRRTRFASSVQRSLSPSKVSSSRTAPSEAARASTAALSTFSNCAVSALQTTQTTGCTPRTVCPQTRQMYVGISDSRTCSTASSRASFSAFSAVRRGMKMSITCSITEFVTTECPRSSAKRRTAVRAICFTKPGTFSIRCSASGVQVMLASALTSIGG